ALIGHLAPREQRGTAYGLTGSATFMGNFLGPLLGAVVAATVSLRAIFVVTAALLGMNLVWIAFAVREPARPRPREGAL
ncbi:MAG TPA: multidrug efflux MFS transporter, partial [Firmicutes bacterium]|nr:multidrug efflux MFS transporter [Bacillota bacterium]